MRKARHSHHYRRPRESLRTHLKRAFSVWLLASLVVIFFSVFTVTQYSRVEQHEVLVGHAIIPWTTVAFTVPEDMKVTQYLVEPGNRVQQGQIVAKLDTGRASAKLHALEEETDAHRFLLDCLQEKTPQPPSADVNPSFRDLLAQYAEDCKSTLDSVMISLNQLSREAAVVEAALKRLETRYRYILTNQSQPAEHRLRSALLMKNDREAILTQKATLGQLMVSAKKQAVEGSAAFQTSASRLEQLRRETNRLSNLKADPHLRSHTGALILTTPPLPTSEDQRPRPITGLSTERPQELSEVMLHMPIGRHVHLHSGHRVSLTFQDTELNATGTIQEIQPISTDVQRIAVALDNHIQNVSDLIGPQFFSRHGAQDGAIKVSLRSKTFSTLFNLQQTRSLQNPEK